MTATQRAAAPLTDDAGSVQISVIIPHYNDTEGLALCHARLLAQTLPRDRFEIVVVDNNSRCSLDAVRAAAPTARMVVEPQQGAGPARNAGVAASRGEILAFIDSDCVPDPGWLEAGLSALARFDFVGGQVVTSSKVPDHPNAVEAFEIVFNFDFRRYIEEVGFTGTGNMFVPRPIFDRVGGFRTGVSEDMDWSFRARNLGYRIGYAEASIVGHPARQNWPELHRRWQRLVQEHFELALEQPHGRTRFALKALAMPLSIIPHTIKIIQSPRLSGTTARLGAILTLVRLRLWRSGAMLERALRSPGGRAL